MKLKLLLCFQLAVLFSSFSQDINLNYPELVDSLILKHRKNEAIVMMENNYGFRKEFWFEGSTLKKFIYQQYMNSEGAEHLPFADTCRYYPDSIACNDNYPQSLDHSATIYINPEINDSNDFYIQHDYTSLHLNPTSSKHIDRSSNSRVITEILKNPVTLDLVGEKRSSSFETVRSKNYFIENYSVLHTPKAIYVLDSNDFRFVYVLHLKNNQVTKIVVYLSSTLYQDDKLPLVSDYFTELDKRQPTQTIQAVYCKNATNLPKARKSKKVQKAFEEYESAEIKLR